MENERLKFVAEWQSGDWKLAELCREFGISRQTGYKWLGRYEVEGLDGLKDRSSCRHHHPNQVSDAVVTAILRVRAKHVSWGARTIWGWLVEHHPDEAWPAPSTIHEVLVREGRIVPRRRTSSRTAPGPGVTPYGEVNATWCCDFKGWFRTADGGRCEPLTLIDGATRYLLRCQAVSSVCFSNVQPILETAFREYGLPGSLRSDNGAPFATRALGGLSKLAIWLIKLDVRPERIEPGQPQQNGRLERFHKTLKAECASPPAANLGEQHRRFQRFRREYNEDRPHHALELKTPASVYAASPRPMPRRVPEPDYPDDCLVRLVNRQGEIRWRGYRVPVSEVLAGERVALQMLGDPEEQYWRLSFGRYPLALWDEQCADWLTPREEAQVLQRFPPDEPWLW